MATASSDPSRLRRESLSATWLAARLGTEPERIELRRRSGELLGFRDPGGQEFLYPVWQFDRDGTPFPWIARILEASRDAGIPNDRLYEVLSMRSGVVGGRRVSDLLREGDEEAALAAIRSARSVTPG
jgi:hypothetical protein